MCVYVCNGWKYVNAMQWTDGCVDELSLLMRRSVNEDLLRLSSGTIVRMSDGTSP